jgi:hypothetical protein
MWRLRAEFFVMSSDQTVAPDASSFDTKENPRF